LLLVAAKKDMVLSHAELIRDAGFTPAVIDVASFANQNAFEFLAGQGADPLAESQADDGDPVVAETEESSPIGEDEAGAPIPGAGEFVALIDVGGGLTNVHIVKDGLPYFTRDLPVGTTHFVEEFQKELGLTFADAQRVAQGDLAEVDEHLVTEIVRRVGADIFQGLEPSLSYLQTSGEAEGIDRIVLSGGGAKLPGLSDYLGGCYGVSAEVADPLAGLQYDQEVFGETDPAALSPLLAVSVGLALREVES